MSRIAGSIDSTYDRAKRRLRTRIVWGAHQHPSLLADNHRMSDEGQTPADEAAQARRSASRRTAHDVPDVDRRGADRRQQKPGLVGLLIDLLKFGHAKKRDDD
jgi:hypothetical protein